MSVQPRTPSETTAADRVLRESERRLRELFDGVDAIIASLDEAGRVVYNARLHDILGYDPGALPGQFDWEMLVHPDEAEACTAVWRSTTTSWEMEYRMRRADGGYVWVRDRGRRATDPDGRLTALFCVITDITEIREAREARETAVLEQARIFRELVEGARFEIGPLADEPIERITANSVTLSHEPVPALGWPAMTMTFALPDGRSMVRGVEFLAPFLIGNWHYRWPC